MEDNISTIDEENQTQILEIIENNNSSLIEDEENDKTSTLSMLTKEQLSTYHCCRLCAQGTQVDNNTIKTDIFISLFDKEIEKISSLEESYPIYQLINKYLPIEILESDSLYPKTICMECFVCLKNTIEFFNKICEGQRQLAMIFNKTFKNDDELNKKKSCFSNENPLYKVAKRRGRPRKKEKIYKPKIIKSTPTTTSLLSSSLTKDTITLKEDPIPIGFTERRTKRQSRPPMRYVDQVIPSTFKNDLMEEDDYEENEKPQKQEEPNIGSVDGETSFISYSFHTETDINQHNLMEVGKLDTLMMNEDVSEKDNVGSSETATNKNNLTNQQPIVSKELDNQEKLNNDNEDDDDKNDKTVKLSDFYRGKKPTRRKKKRGGGGNNSQIQCEQCPKIFNHTSSLVYHRLSVHEKTKSWKCTVCGRCFTHKQLLTNHMNVHTNDTYFTCDTCPAKFKSRASLYTHKKSRHSAVREHTCDVCGSQFSLKSSLTGHMRLHTGEKPFHCDFCEKKFAQRSSLREHRRTHTGEKPYKCDVCLKSYKTASQLRSHKFCHSITSTHLCQICGKSFNHAENFKYHMRRHNSEKPVECGVCLKRFTESWTYKKHLRLHTGEKPYQCFVCKKQFSDPSNFAKHKKIHSLKTHENQQKVTEANVVAETEHSSAEYLLSDTLISINNEEELGVCVDEAGNYITTTTDGTTSSIVQILDTENMTYQTITQEDQEVEQVIYVYSDGGSLYTFAIAEDETQSQEVAVENDDAVMDVGSLYNPNDMDSQYYSLQRVGDSTIAAPIALFQQPETSAKSFRHKQPTFK